MAALLMLDTRISISGSNTAVNTWHVSLGGAITVPEANLLIAGFKAFYDAQSTWRANATSPITGSRVLWADLSTWQKPVGKPGTPTFVPGKWTTPPTIIGATPATSTAGAGGTSLPQQLATVVSWRSSFAGRSGRGRTYLGPIGANGMTGTNVTAAFVTAINNAATALINAVVTTTVASGAAFLTIWSPTTGIVRNILSGSSDTVFDTMRSRVK